MAGDEGGIAECFSLSGLIKLLETCMIFTCMMLHRIGNQSYQVFYGATDLVLDKEDVRWPMEADAEILGTGTVTTFTIVTPLILLAYVTQGRKAIQALHLDAIFCFVAAVTLIAAGGMTCFAWNNYLVTDQNVNRSNYEAAGALGVMTAVTGILYLIDFFYVMYQNAVITSQQY